MAAPTAPTLPPLVTDLLEPAAYPHEMAQVRLIQTHISYLFLTGDYVYKIKKPVDFGFLDYTTLDKRRHFCHEEVRLNRRLSPDIYLGVVEVRRDEGGRHTIEGEGETVDYAVMMRELPQSAALSALLEAGKADRGMIERLGQLVAGFHLHADTNDEITAYGCLDKIRFSIDENFAQTEGFIGQTIEAADWRRLQDYSNAFMEAREGLFAERVARGKIRDCHGDLHTSNVYFTDRQVYVLDGIEFNRRFRYLDTTADLAFLLMDLDFRGFPQFTNRLLNTYLQFSNDYHLLGLLDFYRVYRAYVRAKVTGFEFAMPELEPARREEVRERARAYYRLALEYAQREPRPVLMATVGLIGSGKSYIARRVAEQAGAVIVRSDAVRKVLAGATPDESRKAAFGAGIYNQEMSELTYAEMLVQARHGLEAGWPVILDATYSRAAQRAEIVRFAEEGGWPLLFIHCGCQDEVIRERLRARSAGSNISDAGLDLLDQVRASFEEPNEPGAVERTVCIMGGQPEEQRVGWVMQAMNRLLQGGR